MPVPWGFDDHPVCPSRDHVVPVSQGGSTSGANLRLAHRYCNEQRDRHPRSSIRVAMYRALLIRGFDPET